MPNKFLHETVIEKFGRRTLRETEVPAYITDNLNPVFELPYYQKEAFASFIHYFNNDLPGKEQPVHFLFNIATGSGKTLIMAGLILYFYRK